MKVIIAGGRNYSFSKEDVRFIDSLILEITEVVSGGATGADKCGEKWANSRDIPVKVFKADWSNMEADVVVPRTNRYGKPYNAAAGHLRNAQMAEYADAVILFPGGKGTDNMFKEAKDIGLIIYDRRDT